MKKEIYLSIAQSIADECRPIRDINELTGIPSQLVRYYVDKMEEMGLVHRYKSGDVYCFRLIVPLEEVEARLEGRKPEKIVINL
jgi:DNA-binding MarR family transcriptional regulator